MVTAEPGVFPGPGTIADAVASMSKEMESYPSCNDAYNLQASVTNVAFAGVWRRWWLY